jgi:hypothetical protein
MRGRRGSGSSHPGSMLLYMNKGVMVRGEGLGLTGKKRGEISNWGKPQDPIHR